MKQERRTENIYFFYGIIRLKNCFSIELLSPIYGAKRSKKDFPKSALLFLSSCFLLQVMNCVSHSNFFFPLQKSPCEAIIFDLLRSPKLYFCSFLLMPCHTVRNIINWHLLLALSLTLDNHKKLPAARKLRVGWAIFVVQWRRSK